MTESEAIHALLDEVGILIWHAESIEDPISGVKQIDLSESELSDTALECLKYFPRLEWLCLEDAVLPLNGLWHLAEMPSLKELELKGTQVTEEEIAMLRKAHPACKIDC